jgi:hypothetical protein
MNKFYLNKYENWSDPDLCSLLFFQVFRNKYPGRVKKIKRDANRHLSLDNLLVIW